MKYESFIWGIGLKLSDGVDTIEWLKYARDANL